MAELHETDEGDEGDEDEPAEAGRELPAVQVSHTPEQAELVRPAWSPYVPAGHSVQASAPARAYVPGQHGTQVTAPSGANEPAAQIAVQVKVAPPAPVRVPAKPEAQTLQAAIEELRAAAVE